jgi:hypothetical protein
MSEDHNNDDASMPDAPPLERCLLFLGDGKIRVNEQGRARFKDRFQRAGFDVDKIRTLDEFEAALYGSWHIVIGDMKKGWNETMVRTGQKGSLQDQAVRAIMDVDFERADALHARQLRVQNSGLKPVKKD